MSSRIVDLVILAEDLRSATMLRRYAEHLVNRRRIRVVPFAKGRGAGDQHVLAGYPPEVREYRRCAAGNLKRCALIVHLDADTGTVEKRHRQLDQALKDARPALSARSPEERIAIVVPRRHTETWLHGLFDSDTTEEADCKRDPRLRNKHDAMLRPAADELRRLTRSNAPPPPDSLPSVAAAIPELRRLESQ